MTDPKSGEWTVVSHCEESDHPVYALPATPDADEAYDRLHGVDSHTQAAQEPCPECGGSMRFCECMDDPFAPAECDCVVGICSEEGECCENQACSTCGCGVGGDGKCPCGCMEEIERTREAFALGAAWALGDDEEAPAALRAQVERLAARAVELATERDLALRMHAVQFERANRLEVERDEYERRWEEDARPAFATVKAIERLADKFGATPDWSMSHHNVATSIRTALTEED